MRYEIDAPEMGRWRKKFDADALALGHRFAKIHHAALLLFLREWVGEHRTRCEIAGR